MKIENTPHPLIEILDQINLGNLKTNLIEYEISNGPNELHGDDFNIVRFGISFITIQIEQLPKTKIKLKFKCENSSPEKEN